MVLRDQDQSRTDRLMHPPAPGDRIATHDVMGRPIAVHDTDHPECPHCRRCLTGLAGWQMLRHVRLCRPEPFGDRAS